MALATDVSAGEIQLAGDLAGDGGAQVGSSPQLTHMPGLTPGQYINPKMTVDAKGRVSAIVQATPAEIGATLPVASASTVGVVSIGSNINITSSPTNGYQEINLGGTATLGGSTGLDACAFYSFGVQVDGGTTYTVNAQGSALATFQDLINEINNDTTGVTASLSGGNLRITSNKSGRGSMIDVVNDATFGCVSGYVSTNAPVDGTDTCELYVNTATDSVLGVVRIGSGIDLSNGIISIAPPDIATASTLGSVKVPTSGNLSVDASGNLTVREATSSLKGVISVPGGDGLSVDGAGALTYTMPVATDLVLGGVKEGVGVSISVDGTISTTPGSIPAATTTTIGGVIVPGGDGLSVDVSGNLTFTPQDVIATTTTLGSVIVPASGSIDIDGSGNISIPPAENASLGVVQSANINNITITSGSVDIGSNVAVKNASNTFLSVQSTTPASLTSGTTIAVDGSQSNIFTLTLNHNATVSTPTNLAAGATYMFVITQGVTGGSLTFSSDYKFSEDSILIPSVGVGKVDVVSCVSDGTNLYCSINRGF